MTAQGGADKAALQGALKAQTAPVTCFDPYLITGELNNGNM